MTENKTESASRADRLAWQNARRLWGVGNHGDTWPDAFAPGELAAMQYPREGTDAEKKVALRQYRAMVDELKKSIQDGEIAIVTVQLVHKPIQGLARRTRVNPDIEAWSYGWLERSRLVEYVQPPPPKPEIREYQAITRPAFAAWLRLYGFSDGEGGKPISEHIRAWLGNAWEKSEVLARHEDRDAVTNVFAQADLALMHATYKFHELAEMQQHARNVREYLRTFEIFPDQTNQAPPGMRPFMELAERWHATIGNTLKSCLSFGVPVMAPDSTVIEPGRDGLLYERAVAASDWLDAAQQGGAALVKATGDFIAVERKRRINISTPVVIAQAVSIALRAAYSWSVRLYDVAVAEGLMGRKETELPASPWAVIQIDSEEAGMKRGSNPPAIRPNEYPPIEGNIPPRESGRLATKAAWEIECEMRRPATDVEVMARLKEWGKKGAEDSLLDCDKLPIGASVSVQTDVKNGAIPWQTKKGEIRAFTLQACQKALEKWRNSRQQ